MDYKYHSSYMELYKLQMDAKHCPKPEQESYHC